METVAATIFGSSKATLTGPWSNVAYLKGEAGHPYFVCAPSKFLGPGNKITLFYSANWRPERPGVASWKAENGPSGAYSLCVAEYELILRAGKSCKID